MSGGLQKRAFVTGATGGIGSVLCERLASDGWLVRAVARSSSDTAVIAGIDGVTIVDCDLFDESALATAMRDCNAVFHLAAKVHAADTEPRESFDKLNVGATRHVVNAAVAAGVESFVFFSTVAVYPDRDEVFDELSEVSPSTSYGVTKLAAESIVLEKKEQMRVTILRLPVVYGPRDRGNVRRLIDAIAKGRFVIPGNGANIKTMVAVENVVHAAIAVATDPRAAGKIYIVTDERTSSLSEIVLSISNALPKPRRAPHVPVALLGIFAGVADAIRGVTGANLPITRDQVAKLAANTRYSGELIRKDLGIEYPARLEAGIKAAVDGYRRDAERQLARPTRS
jgi:nucleoside-diphosphate-sugar epimerase